MGRGRGGRRAELPESVTLGREGSRFRTLRQSGWGVVGYSGATGNWPSRAPCQSHLHRRARGPWGRPPRSAQPVPGNEVLNLTCAHTHARDDALWNRAAGAAAEVESSSFATAACKTKASRTQPELRAQECARARRTSATTKPAQRRLLRCRAATPDAAAGLSPEGAAHDIRRTRSCVGRHSGRDCNGICRCRGEERRRSCRCAQRCACCGGKRRTCRAQCCRSSKACAASSQTCRSVPRRRSVVIFRRKCGGCFRGTRSCGVCCSHGDGFARNAWGG